MAYFQRLEIMGVAGTDPVLKILDTGPYARFSVAVDEWHRNPEGRSTKITTWFRCSAFGRVAEQCVKAITKGTYVFIEGRIRVRKVEDREFWSVTVDLFRRINDKPFHPEDDVEAARKEERHVIGAHDK
jgi:single stranded DNA-binding protein